MLLLSIIKFLSPNRVLIIILIIILIVILIASNSKNEVRRSLRLRNGKKCDGLVNGCDKTGSATKT